SVNVSSLCTGLSKWTPTQCVLTDRKLADIVADDHRVTQKLMGQNAAPQRAFGGDPHWVGCHGQRGDAKALEMCLPGLGIDQLLVGVFRQTDDDGPGQRALAHVTQRCIIDDVIGVPGAQQVEKVHYWALANGSPPSSPTLGAGACLVT